MIRAVVIIWQILSVIITSIFVFRSSRVRSRLVQPTDKVGRVQSGDSSMIVAAEKAKSLDVNLDKTSGTVNIAATRKSGGGPL